jgi:hypothetical protein
MEEEQRELTPMEKALQAKMEKRKKQQSKKKKSADAEAPVEAKPASTKEASSRKEDDQQSAAAASSEESVTAPLGVQVETPSPPAEKEDAPSLALPPGEPALPGASDEGAVLEPPAPLPAPADPAPSSPPSTDAPRTGDAPLDDAGVDHGPPPPSPPPPQGVSDTQEETTAAPTLSSAEATPDGKGLTSPEGGVTIGTSDAALDGASESGEASVIDDGKVKEHTAVAVAGDGHDAVSTQERVQGGDDKAPTDAPPVDDPTSKESAPPAPPVVSSGKASGADGDDTPCNGNDTPWGGRVARKKDQSGAEKKKQAPQAKSAAPAMDTDLQVCA